MIFKDAIIAWRNMAPWQNDAQVEQDLILSRLIYEIFSHPFLKEQLIFRGGTCLNKIYWKESTRYSEDLDFVQVTSGSVVTILDALKKILKPIFGKDPVKKLITKRCLKLFYEFTPEINPGEPLRVKIETNLTENFTVEGVKKKNFKLDSLWKSGLVKVNTFSLNELLATKVRALYQRKKGRDLYDLWKAKDLNPNWQRVSEIFYYYMSHDKTFVHRDALINNLRAKLENQDFVNDMTGLVKSLKDYNIKTAADFVIDEIFGTIPESKTKQKKKARRWRTVSLVH